MNQQVQSLHNFAAEKRAQLIYDARKRQARGKILQVLAGITSFLSGVGIVSVLASLTHGVTPQIISAALAFASTCIALLSNHFFDIKDTIAMFEGAAKFLVLREQMVSYLSSTSPQINAEKDLTDSYVNLSGTYDKYLSQDIHGERALRDQK